MAGLSSGMAKKTGAKSSPARGNRFCGLLVGGGIEARDQSGPMDSEGGVLRHFQEMVRDGSFDMEDDIPVILEISRTGGLVNWSIPLVATVASAAPKGPVRRLTRISRTVCRFSGQRFRSSGFSLLRSACKITR